MEGFDGLEKRSPDARCQDEEERKLKEELLEVFSDLIEVSEGGWLRGRIIDEVIDLKVKPSRVLPTTSHLIISHMDHAWYPAPLT